MVSQREESSLGLHNLTLQAQNPSPGKITSIAAVKTTLKLKKESKKQRKKDFPFLLCPWLLCSFPTWFPFTKWGLSITKCFRSKITLTECEVEKYFDIFNQIPDLLSSKGIGSGAGNQHWSVPLGNTESLKNELASWERTVVTERNWYLFRYHERFI